ncbi:MAG: DUF5107 domain-containing protein, partial [Bacilli bacterium]
KQDAYKYIFNANQKGAGLLHTASDSLEGVKLFSWGHIEGSSTWQRYLTNEAGPYIEIQAGLTKTQYGCKPMPANTTWEFMESFRWDCIDHYNVNAKYEDVMEIMNNKVKDYFKTNDLNQLLIKTRALACTKAKVIHYTKSHGIIENTLRTKTKQRLLCDHLEFNYTNEQLPYINIIKGIYDSKLKDYTMYINKEDEALILIDYFNLKQDDYIAAYLIGVYYIYLDNYDLALRYLNKSIALQETYYNNYALGVLMHNYNNERQSIKAFVRAISLDNDNASLVKAIFTLIKDYQDGLILCDLYPQISNNLQANGRIKLLYCYSSILQGNATIVKNILDDPNNILVVDDIREGEELFTTVYTMYQKLIKT